MQIVKIYPKVKSKCHFSVRQSLNKFYVFEGDKVLRSDLKSLFEAELEIRSIVRTRKENGKLFGVAVNYITDKELLGDAFYNNSNPIDIKNVVKRECRGCKKDFSFDKTKRGASRKVFCTKECCIKYNNDKRYNATEQQTVNIVEENGLRKCKSCKISFVPKRRDSFNCSQKCSQKSYNLKIKKQKIKASKKVFDLTKAENITNERDSLEKGIGDVIIDPFNTAEPIVRDYVLNDYDLEEDNEVINKFHDYTEKQMSLKNRKIIRADFLASDIIEYIFLWCEINQKLGRPLQEIDLFCDLERLNLTNLSRYNIVNIMPELIKNNLDECYELVKFNYKDEFTIVLIKERLKKAILEDILPTEEQFQRGAFLKPLISQMLFTKSILDNQNIKEPQTNKEEEIEPVKTWRTISVSEQYEEEEKRQNELSDVLDMVDNLTEQNLTLFKKLDKCLDISSKAKEETLYNQRVLFDIENHIRQIAERVEKITQKRKGFFG